MFLNKIYFGDFDVKNVRAFKDGSYWFLDATLEREDSHGKEEINIPKILFPVNHSALTHIKDYYTLEFYNNELPVIKDSNGVFYTIKKTDKPEKLTIEDIEKRLGYKVEIVSKKG